MRTRAMIGALGLVLLNVGGAAAQERARPVKVFISVDMEGVGGIGTGELTRTGGKDYEVGRRLMTGEVNAVVSAIRARGPADILVNDSHGDMQNLLHTELDPEVRYIQGSTKRFGMVQGLDPSFDAAIFVGYHARAGTPDAFRAHTGSGSVKGLWLNGREVGEGGMNAAYAGSMGVPVVLASGDSAFAVQFSELVEGVRTVTTKTSVGSDVAVLVHPEVVRRRLREATRAALDDLDAVRPLDVGDPVRIRMRFASTTRPYVLLAVPGMEREDGFTVGYTASDMAEAYGLIRLMYRFVDF